MKPRDFLNFFKTKSGKLVAFGAVMAAGLVIFSALRKHHQPDDRWHFCCCKFDQCD